MSLAKERAHAILNDLEISSPELLQYLREICVQRGALVREAPLQGSEARLTVNGDHGIITVRRHANYPARTRFSIAHELGHFELHRNRKGALNCDEKWMDEADQFELESEANEFASELLMPEFMIRHEIESSIPGFKIIEKISERFQTSLLASAKRYIQISPEACAAVIYSGTQIRYAARSGEWKKIVFPLNDIQVDARSYAFDAQEGVATPQKMAPIEADAWLKIASNFRNETLLEESRYFKGLDFGISLLWVKQEKFFE